MLMEQCQDENPEIHEAMVGSINFREKVLEMSSYLLAKTKSTEKMKAFLREEVVGEGSGKYKLKFEEGLNLPHEPLIKVYDVVPHRCSVFKSAIKPMLIMFKARRFPEGWSESDEMPELIDYPVMVKNGDDMRQD